MATNGLSGLILRNITAGKHHSHQIWCCISLYFFVEIRLMSQLANTTELKDRETGSDQFRPQGSHIEMERRKEYEAMTENDEGK